MNGCMRESLDLLNQWLNEKKKEGKFLTLAGAKPVLITTISNDDPFTPECLQGLYVLEQALLEKGVDAGAYSVMKYRIGPGATYPGAANSNITVYGYKIVFDDDSYKVRRESDMDFLAYFSTLLLSDEEEAEEKPSLLKRLTSWLKGKAV